MAATPSMEIPLLSNNSLLDEELASERAGNETATLSNETRRTLHTVPERFSHLPGMEGHSWKDNFFEGHDDVIAVFDVDTQKMEDFYDRCFPLVHRLYILITSFQLLMMAYYIFYLDIPWQIVIRLTLFNFLLFLLILFNLKGACEKFLEFAKGQRIAVTTEGLMTNHLSIWRLLFITFFTLLVPSFIYTFQPQDRKIPKYRFDEIRSCHHWKYNIPIAKRECSKLIILIKGQYCFPLYAEFVEYPDTLIGLLNHLKEQGV